MTAKEYWTSVEKKKFELLAMHEMRRESGDFKGQPSDGRSLFVTSIENYQRETTPGIVTQVDYRNAAKGIIDGINRPSTPEEIKGHHAREQALREEYQKIDMMRDKKVFITMTPQEAGITVQAPAAPVIPTPPVTSPKGKA